MRALGVDVGSRRIGVAISDPTGTIAQSLTVIARTGWRAVIAEIRRLVNEYHVEQVVVGLPLRLDGTEGDAAHDAAAFAGRLRGVLDVPVVMQDERLSTAEAERALLAQDVRREQRRKRRDAVAAALFLQTFLDRRHAAGKTE
ncbi:MAG: Holliday junction resolvase RuvX [bacterium]